MTGSIDLGIDGIADGEEIGRGGFGTVFRARQVNVGRVVAVKVLSAVSLSDETLRRFERECRAMAAVSSHPHITALYDSGVSSSGRPYIVMEHVAGGSLAPRLPLPWPDAVEIGVKVAGALETAHRIGIYHRDVKPENILVSAYGEPMLADFGVAKVADSSETPSGNITASLLHAAPETLSGARPSASTDVYSLASTVFTLIAGHAPFAAQHDEESLAPLITRIATAQVPDLRPDGVPDAVCSVIERGLAKEPGQRPGSPEAFGEQLREAQVACGLSPTEMLIEGRDRTPSGAFPLPADPDDETTISRSRSQVIPVALAAAGAGAAVTAPAVVAPWWRRRVPTVAAGVVAVMLLAGSAFGVTQLRSDDPIVAMQTGDRESVDDEGGDGGTTPPATDESLSPSPPAGGTPVPGQVTTPPGAPTDSPEDRPDADGGDRVTTTPGAPSGPAPSNRAPAIAAVPAQDHQEQTAQSLALAGSDPDGDQLTYQVSGLPSGLSVSGNRIVGTISHAAAMVTSRDSALQARTFTVTVTVSDGRASASTSFPWRVVDSHVTMPSYIGYYGCNDRSPCSDPASLPGIPHLTSPSFACFAGPDSSRYSTVHAQSVPAGTVIRWGAPVTFTYYEQSC